MKKQIDNKFLDLILFISSAIFGFLRSILLFFGIRKTKVKNNIFFDFLNFIFKIWPRYFWKKASLYKLFSLPGDLLNYLFGNRK